MELYHHSPLHYHGTVLKRRKLHLNVCFHHCAKTDNREGVGGTVPPLSKIYVGCTVSLFTVGTFHLAVKAPLTLYLEMGHNSCALV